MGGMDPVSRQKMKYFPAFHRIVLVVFRIPYDVYSNIITNSARFCNQSRIPQALSCIQRNPIGAPNRFITPKGRSELEQQLESSFVFHSVWSACVLAHSWRSQNPISFSGFFIYNFVPSLLSITFGM